MRFPTRRQQLTSGLAVTLVVAVTVLGGSILTLTDRTVPRTEAESATATSRPASTTVPTATVARDEPTNVVPEVTVIEDATETEPPSPTATREPSATVRPTTNVPPTRIPPTTAMSGNTVAPVSGENPAEPVSQDIALEPTSTGTQTPLEGACNNNQSFIFMPLNQTVLSGVVTFTGNATIPNFRYYKMEIRKDSELEYDLFTTFLTVDTPVWHGVLGTLDTRAFENGWYWIRLVVVDDTGNYPERCAWYYPIMN